MTETMMYTSNSNSVVQLTMESLLTAMARITGIAPPTATEEQERWARLAGFPSFDGFKMSPDIYDRLIAYVKRQDSLSDGILRFTTGLPIRVVDTLPPGTCQQGRKVWEGIIATMDSSETRDAHTRWWRLTTLHGWRICSATAAAREATCGFPVRLGSIKEVLGEFDEIEMVDDLTIQVAKDEAK